MKLLISLLLTAVCVHCIPLYEDGRGHYTETRTSYVTGYNGTLGINLGAEVGYKDGVVVLRTTKNIGPDFKAYNESVVRSYDRTPDVTSPPPNYGSTNCAEDCMLIHHGNPGAIQNNPWAMPNNPWIMPNNPRATQNYQWGMPNNQLVTSNNL